ncbi:MAG: signal peptidase II [Phycisphaerales bacterium]|nr:signal peptidase II [Phycisphaerales bacterium]MCB9862155.1 signal peptidase II [Phycisphaerales bacterium]
MTSLDSTDSLSTSTPSTVNASAGADRSAIVHVPSHVRLWLVAVLGLWADLATKAWAFSTLNPHEPRLVIKNLCSLQLSLNPGALFGLGAGMAPVFVGASVLALMFVLYLFANSGTRRWSMHIALGLVLGGALGNLYDRTTQQAYVAYMTNGYRIIGDRVDTDSENILRIRRPNSDRVESFGMSSIDLSRSGFQPVVRDFIKIEAKFGKFEVWPWIFNIADALLVVGVAMLLLNFWADHRHHRAEQLAANAAIAGSDSPRDNS